MQDHIQDALQKAFAAREAKKARQNNEQVTEQAETTEFERYDSVEELISNIFTGE